LQGGVGSHGDGALSGTLDANELQQILEESGIFDFRPAALIKELDEEAVRFYLEKLGAKVTILTEEQVAYIGVPPAWPYKQDH
jgi:adenosylhomocysteinase